MNGTCPSKLLKSLAALVMIIVVTLASSSPLFAFSYEDERKVGKEIYDSIKDAGFLVEDEELNAYINEIGNRLVKQGDQYPLDFTFSIIRSSGINAFATPGGYIYLFTGLIKLAEDESQIAGVLAHEIAHVKARHIARMIAQQRKQTIGTLAAMIAGAFLGGGEGLAAAAGLASATAATMSLKYSREHEEEADRMGMAYMTNVGYDGQGMLDFLRIMRFNQYYSSAIPSYFLTHPETSERIRYLTLLLQTRYSNGGATEILGGLERHQTRLYLSYQSPRDNVRYFSERISRNPDDIEALYGLAVSESKMGRLEQSRQSFVQALRLAPDDWEITRDFGISLFRQGNIAEAVEMLQQANAMKADDRNTLFYLGRGYEAIGENHDALDLFERINAMDAEDTETYYHLAMLYGKEEQLGESHYHFGEFFKRTGKNQSALFHFRTALDHFPADSPRAANIKKALEELDS